MPQEALDTLAADLGLTSSGLRKRIANLGLQPERGSRGRVVLTPELEATLREADRLMGAGAGTATVRRRLGLAREAQETTTGPSTEHTALELVSRDAHELREAVTQAIAEQTALAEKYAVAAHRVGELEATTRAVEAERDKLTRDLEQARAELTQARALQTEQAQAIATLAAELTQARRPWWRLWT